MYVLLPLSRDVSVLAKYLLVIVAFVFLFLGLLMFNDAANRLSFASPVFDKTGNLVIGGVTATVFMFLNLTMDRM